MNQALPDEVSAGASAPSADGLGATFKALREARRVSLSEVSSRLKFSVKQIEALENEQWEKLPSGLPLRGLVKNYGRYLEADTDALMSMLEIHTQSAGNQPLLKDTTGLGAADITPPASEGRSWGWLLVVLILLFVAGFYAVDSGWIPESWLIFR